MSYKSGNQESSSIASSRLVGVHVMSTRVLVLPARSAFKIPFYFWK